MDLLFPYSEQLFRKFIQLHREERMKKNLMVALAMMLVVATGMFAAPTEITFWTSFTPPFSDYLQKMVDTYNQSQASVHAKLVMVPGGSTDVSKLMTAVRGGTGPDVYMLDRFITAERAADGVLTDLTPYIKKADPDMASKFLPFAWSESSFKGKTWSLPFDTDTRALYYRADLLKDAGIDITPLDAKNGPITVDKLKEIAFKYNKTDASGAYTQVGFIPYFAEGWHYTWGFIFGGKFADMKAGKVTPTDPGVVAGFQFLYDYAKALGPQKARTFISTYAPPNNPPQQDPFITGKVAMYITGDWNIASLAQYAPDIKWGVTYLPVPKAGDKPTTWAGGWSFTMPKGAKHPEAAFDFMRWMTGADGQKMYTQLSSHLPTIKALASDNTLFTGEHAFFQQTLSFANNRPALPVGALYWDSLTTAWNSVTDNVATPEEALSKVAPKVQPKLNKFLPLQ
jgi:multiple sugar transport system substrate-binding protein